MQEKVVAFGSTNRGVARSKEGRADQAEEFEERVLKRRCGQKQLVEWRKSAFLAYQIAESFSEDTDKSKKRRMIGARKSLRKLVAGGGFEPPTFGL